MTRADRGFTLIEVMVAIALFGVLSAMAVAGFRGLVSAEGQRGTADAVASTIRNAQVRAVTEGVSMCLSFDTGAETYTLSRYACGTATQRINGPVKVADGRVDLASASFSAPDGSTSPAITFKPSGTAYPGSVRIARRGASKVYTLTVEGLTGRVSIS
ncbi:GspH/FimT family pseudopilin [Nocardioides litoris]|uniref:GspH/FimT family pseudopilin n=1 Tax=Nocardioides litoris TaxID=1926648 RepID=UPI001476CABF|nr:GspH/FimT family pseudopilin [Nocardioides litoris]